MSIITADMIQIRENGVSFIYAKSFIKIHKTFYEKYIKLDAEEDINNNSMEIWYHGLPFWMSTLYLEKVVLHHLTKSIISESDRNDISKCVEICHDAYTHILEKIEYNETHLQTQDVFNAAEKYFMEQLSSMKESEIYKHIIDEYNNSNYAYYNYNKYILEILYTRKRDSMQKFNGHAYNATKEKLLKKIFANHALPEPTLQQYNDWLSSEQGLDILDRWTLNRYDLMMTYAHSIKNPKFNIDKYILNNCTADYNYNDDDESYRTEEDDDEDMDDDDDNSNNDIEGSFQSNGAANATLDEDVANFNINL
jgi:hypothetical protein